MLRSRQLPDWTQGVAATRDAIIRLGNEWTARMKRFHIAIAVRDLDASIVEYSKRLGQPATVIVQGKYAMWRTDLLNFSINQNPGRTGELRHIGFEDDGAQGFASSRDINGIEWECFSRAAQEQKIIETYGHSERQSDD
jgi:hypothetical protein